MSSGRGRGGLFDGEWVEGDIEVWRGGWNGPGGSKNPVAEVTSVKDNFRSNGRREENQREVKELDIAFRRAGEPATESEVVWLLFGTGTADEVATCSDAALGSTDAELSDTCEGSDG